MGAAGVAGAERGTVDIFGPFQNGTELDPEVVGECLGSTSLPAGVDTYTAPALVTVDFTRPFSIDGETGMRYRGAGFTP